MKPYREMNRQEKLAFYDSHNGATRFSEDIHKRLFGVCGCQFCAETRKTWANNPAPINDQRRKGSRAMSSINVCDRCGGLVTGLALGVVVITTSADYKGAESVSREICPDCVAMLVTLLETPAEAKQKTPYREPWKRPVEEDTTVKDIIRTVVEEVHKAQTAIEAKKVDTQAEVPYPSRPKW